MKREGILNRHLSRLIASLGHKQKLLVCDAGFPIPKKADTIDLAVTKGLPKLPTVLETINKELISEKVMFAEEMPDKNAPLHQELQNIFKEVEFEPLPHEKIMNDVAQEVRGIVRTGDYSPWGNIVLVAGTDPYAWFEGDELEKTPFYKKRAQAIEKAGRRDMFYGSD